MSRCHTNPSHFNTEADMGNMWRGILIFNSLDKAHGLGLSTNSQEIHHFYRPSHLVNVNAIGHVTHQAFKWVMSGTDVDPGLSVQRRIVLVARQPVLVPVDEIRLVILTVHVYLSFYDIYVYLSTTSILSLIGLAS